MVARWEEYWTITYDANGGTYTYDSYKSDTVVKGEQLYLNGSYGYQKDGSILLGWCEDKACEGEVLTGNYWSCFRHNPLCKMGGKMYDHIRGR